MLDYVRFPGFRGASIEEVEQVELRFEHLYWPHLDVDLHLESILDPDRFPLASKAAPRLAAARRKGRTTTRAANPRPSRLV
jgi:hypothetical protein